MNWLLASLLASIVLTVVLNVAVRAFPNAPQRIADRADAWMGSRGGEDDVPRVRVVFPWKAMLLASIGLTIVVNVIAALAR